jgi:PKD repeat protein
VPHAAFKTVTKHPRARRPVAFDARASREVGGAIASYAWTFGDGGKARGRTVSHTYKHPGRYWVTLTVLDRNHTKATVRHRIRVLRRLPIRRP